MKDERLESCLCVGISHTSPHTENLSGKKFLLQSSTHQNKTKSSNNTSIFFIALKLASFADYKFNIKFYWKKNKIDIVVTWHTLLRITGFLDNDHHPEF
jgi:hypothetical protein